MTGQYIVFIIIAAIIRVALKITRKSHSDKVDDCYRSQMQMQNQQRLMQEQEQNRLLHEDCDRQTWNFQKQQRKFQQQQFQDMDHFQNHNML